MMTIKRVTKNIMDYWSVTPCARAARMAADGDWEALKALQNDLKNARRTREPSKDEDTP